jgi:hypothetical protein
MAHLLSGSVQRETNRFFILLEGRLAQAWYLSGLVELDLKG